MVLAVVFLIIAGITIFVVSVGMAIGSVPFVTEGIRDVLIESFGLFLGVFFTLYGIWKAIPDTIKSIIAKILRKIPNLPNWYKRRTIQFEIEGEVNAALREFGKEGAGFVEHEVILKWLKPKEGARRLFFKGGKAYLKLDFDEDKERNLVEALVMYCNECLLLEIRQYLTRPLMRAIDITFIDELLDRRNAVRGRAYFMQEVIPREIEATLGIDKYLDTLELISQHGLFIRLMLPELKEYPGRTQRRIPKKNHLEQIEEFLNFLRITAEDRTHFIKRVWLHLGETIRVGIILVGLTDKLQFEGSKPYVRRTAIDNSKGARTVYLIGYNLGVDFVPKIAREVQQREIADKSEVHEYSALIGNQVKKQAIARLSIPDGAGSKFLSLYPDTADWPDLEEETQISIIGKKIEVEVWERDVDAAWYKRANKAGESVHSSVAGQDAAKVFGVARLRNGPYKTLKRIFKESQYLSGRWIYNGDRIIKR